MAETHLPWRVLDRLVRPYAFAVSGATAVIAWACWAGIAVGLLLDGLPGRIVAAAGFAVVGLLWAGWWGSRDAWMRAGLFITTGVWASVAAILAIDVGVWNVNTALSACWAIASGGAWLLEASDRQER